jgi:hypothetical protein
MRYHRHGRRVDAIQGKSRRHVSIYSRVPRRRHVRTGEEGEEGGDGEHVESESEGVNEREG